MSQAFTVIVPARLASTRLPNKPLADIHGLPMVVRVAQRAALSNASQVVVAADSIEIVQACQAHGVHAILTQVDHPSGSDRLAEASALLDLKPHDVVVNVQGDEPLINPELINQVAELLVQRPSASMSTAAHEIHELAEFTNPNVVKVVIDQSQLALYFSRAPIPWWRDGFAKGIQTLPQPAPLRHIGIYAYRVGFLQSFPTLQAAPIETGEALEQLRALWHGHKIAVHITPDVPGPGVDTPEDLKRVRALYKPS
jgi:3-deoxy-manno-octulosonate cytidylyltransferase (CMP-KDO synthetase)